MKKSLIAIASILAIVAGCAKNDPQAKVSDGTIKASIENTQSRATLSYGGVADNFLVWEEGDSFRLFDGTSGINCTLTSGEGTKFGSFTPESEPAAAGTYYAVYPDKNSSMGAEGVISVVIPDEVSYNPATGVAEKGEDGSVNVMAAKSSSTEIAFKNVCSYLCLSIKGTAEQKVSSVNILAKDGETTVAGTAQITFDEEEPVLAFDGTVSSNTESIVFAEPVSLENVLDLKVAVAPVYTDGIQVIVTLENGEYQILTSDTAIGRNEIVKMPEFTFAAVEVAQIGDVKYTTLAAAVEAANVATEDVTIKLIDNVIVTETVAIENADHKVTLDMNSKVISADAKAMDIKSDVDIIDSSAEKEGAIVSATSYAFYAITDGITMNISDVAFEGAAQYGAARIAGNASVFNISGNASFLNTKEGKTSEYAGLHIGLSAKANTPTVNISGGTFESYSTYGVRNRYGICNVTGGVFTGKTAAFCDANGGNNAVSITGGYFSNTGDTDVINNEGGHINGAISGGYFTKELSAVLLAEGYVCAAESTTGPDGKEYAYKVKEGVLNIASVTISGVTTEYSSLDDAIAAALAADEAKIKILQDCALSAAVTIENKLTLDLNGRTISQSAGNRFNVNNNADAVFTIEDNSVAGTGLINNTSTGGYFDIVVTTGKCILNGGTVQSSTAGQTVRVATGGQFEMNGGRIINTGNSKKIGTSTYSPAALQLRGGTATINAGVLYCKNKYALSVGTEASILNIHGGDFVADSVGAYCLYASGDGLAHVINVDNSVSEPYFVGGVPETGRIFYNAQTVSKYYVSAGYFSLPYLGKNSESPNTYVKKGYKRVEGLDIKKSIEGMERTFVMQVVPED